jgi:DNA-binding MarR family transcriptional regulator
VERQQCPTDRRGSNAVLTVEGFAKLETAAPTHVRGVREHFIDRLSEEQLAHLSAALLSVEIDEQLAAGGCDVAP